MSLFPTIDALTVTFRNLFRKPTTEPLPWKAERERTERYRSTFALVHDENGEEDCIGCKMCEKICPSDVISVAAGGRKESPVTGKKRGYCDDFTLDLNACIVCELCVQVCPTDAIIMVSAPEQPGFGREDLVLTMDKLYNNEKLDKPSWANGTKLMEMQDPKRGLPKPEPKARAAKPAAAPKKKEAAADPSPKAENKPAAIEPSASTAPQDPPAASKKSPESTAPAIDASPPTAPTLPEEDAPTEQAPLEAAATEEQKQPEPEEKS